jgi:hypothetical protein
MPLTNAELRELGMKDRGLTSMYQIAHWTIGSIREKAMNNSREAHITFTPTNDFTKDYLSMYESYIHIHYPEIEIKRMPTDSESKTVSYRFSWE